uniref:Uncharacterized protein n=1 Tax=viral metagenome TaxID=1070528 RepID=A0A6C0F5Q3_9ZZZZ
MDVLVRRGHRLTSHALEEAVRSVVEIHAVAARGVNGETYVVHKLSVAPRGHVHVCRAKGRRFLIRDGNKIHALNEANSKVIEYLSNHLLVKTPGNSRDANGVPVLEQTELFIGIKRRSHCSNNCARIEMYL